MASERQENTGDDATLKAPESAFGGALGAAPGSALGSGGERADESTSLTAVPDIGMPAAPEGDLATTPSVPSQSQPSRSSSTAGSTASSQGDFSPEGYLLPGAKLEQWGGEIESLISFTSGEADVYTARKENVLYAVKLYRIGVVPKGDIVEKLMGVDHPGVVRTHRCGQHWGRFYEVLTFCPGGALNKRDMQGQYTYLPLSSSLFARVVDKLNEGLRHLHAHGIVHRDIKPGNILVRDLNAADVMLADFGISSLLDVDGGKTERMTSEARTEGFAAPEVYSGITRREVDFYALGVTFYILLTGKDPFHGLNPRQIMCTTVQGRTVEHMFSMPEAAVLDDRTRMLLKGLLCTQNSKRWGYDQIRRWVAGEDVAVASGSVVELPVFRYGEVELKTPQDMAEACLRGRDTELWSKFLLTGEITAWVTQFDRALALSVRAVAEWAAVEGRASLGLQRVAWLLDNDLPWVSPGGRAVTTPEELASALRNEGPALQPVLCDESSSLWHWMEARERLEPVAQWARDWFRRKNRPFANLLEGLILKVRGTDTFTFDDGTAISSLFDLNTLPHGRQAALMDALNLALSTPYSALRLWVELKERLAADRELLAFLDETGHANARALCEILPRFGYMRHGEWAYRGECIQSSSGSRLPHGLGSALRRDGTRHLGFWQEGVRQGRGLCRFGNGLLYEGNYENGVESGWGRLKKDKAWMYEGSFAFGAQNGQGRLTLVAGDIFEGQFQSGSLEGFGTHVNGRKDALYVGSWSAGKREGTGLFVQADGSREQGEWRKNKLHEGDRLRFYEREGRYRRERVHAGRVVWQQDVSFLTRQQCLQKHLPKAVAPAATATASLLALVTLSPYLPFSAHVGLAAFAFLSLAFAGGTWLQRLVRLLSGRTTDGRGHTISDWSDSTRMAAKGFAQAKFAALQSATRSGSPSPSPSGSQPGSRPQATPRRPAA